jgi:hypothetical protein
MDSNNAAKREREVFILGGVGAILGGILGLVVSGNPGNWVAIGVGILSGTALGEIAAYALHRRLNVEALNSLERGLFGFVTRYEWRLFGAAILFGLCALYLLVIARPTTVR